MIIGKQVGGPKKLFSTLMWGGCLFVNVWTRSAMIPLPQIVIDFLLMIGINPID